MVRQLGTFLCDSVGWNAGSSAQLTAGARTWDQSNGFFHPRSHVPLYVGFLNGFSFYRKGVRLAVMSAF